MDSFKSWMVGQKFLNKQHFPFWNLKKKTTKNIHTGEIPVLTEIFGYINCLKLKGGWCSELAIYLYLKFFVTSGSNIEYFSS